MGKRYNLDLEMIGVPVGASLWHKLSSGETITCIVIQQYPPRVVHEGEVVSLSEVMNRINYPPSPSEYLSYGDETLSQRRARFESYHAAPYKGEAEPIE